VKVLRTRTRLNKWFRVVNELFIGDK